MNKAKITIELVPYSSLWQKFYVKECLTLQKLLRSNLVEAYHVGSTAIVDIVTRPTLDILCVVHTLDGIRAFESEFSKVGLSFKASDLESKRLLFTRQDPKSEGELCHIHIIEKSSTLINDYIDFRDYLNAESKVAKEYNNLKLELQQKYPDTPKLYNKAKSEFIQIVLNNLKK